MKIQSIKSKFNRKSLGFKNSWPMKMDGIWRSMAYENSWPMKINGLWKNSQLFENPLAYENLWPQFMALPPMKIYWLWKAMAYKNSQPLKTHGPWKLMGHENLWPMKIQGLGKSLAYENSTAHYCIFYLSFSSFQTTVEGSENDMRFIYCACCISYILNDWSGVDIPRVVQYIKKSRVMPFFVY